MALTLGYPYPLTEEFVIELSQANPLLQIETTAEGEIIIAPLTGSAASSGEASLVQQVANWNDRCRLGRVLSSSGGVTLFDGAIKSPDATWISHERWNAASELDRRRAFRRLAPDAVFELLSPSDELERLVTKMGVYLRNGARVAVLLNPRNRRVRLYRPSREPEVSENPDDLPISEMPGFRLDARAIFAATQDEAGAAATEEAP
ncbi:MAG: Uma2 family endonuclease [Vulcanimicrobiaceae bacterium]